MSPQLLYRRIVSGEAGAWSAPVRGLLRAAEPLYRAGVALRNRHFDRHDAKAVLPVPVISVGNITVGGTGKTPFVVDLVRRLEQKGLSPAVVARGYHAPDGEPNDEELLIRRRCPGVGYVADPDRVQGAIAAHRRFGADVIVLDDAFQHRRLARDLDIVLIDTTCPFGYGHLLPRGLLREPVASIKRAHVIALTRCDQAPPATLDRVRKTIRGITDDALLLETVHRVAEVVQLNGCPLEGGVAGKRAVLFAAIARPDAFAATVARLGADVVGCCWWPDHHRYRRHDIERLVATDRFPPHDLLLTTEKDAMKLRALACVDHLPIAVVNLTIDFLANTAEQWDRTLDRLLERRKAE